MPRNNSTKRKAERKITALARQHAASLRSKDEQLVLLGARLGEGVGALKERWRLGGLVVVGNH